MAAPLVK